ncbi:MAG: hypothetical protein A2017_16980 [Lentisphaerae bacterium GWF2_44_16]|nr:MAG: hypothetical protein A2017_16980 [Lentisphaerae bacterium GWF2_44_16]
MITGILAGFAAAAAQSISYILSRIYIGKFQSAVLLLSVSHVIMGIFSALLFPFLKMGNGCSLNGCVMPFAGCTLFYVFGQMAFFMALKKTDASRVSPLLGLKILFLAIFFSVFMKQGFSYLQWLAVLMCMFAALLLNWSGGRIPWRGLGWILLACICYSLSDLNIKIMIDRLDNGHDSMLARSIFSVCACYMACGVMGLVALCFIPRPRWEMWKAALPFSMAWLAGAFFLFTSFGFIGPVFGNIVQSSRGLISIVLGVLIALAGFPEIEKRISRGVFTRRVFAAILMLASIALFSAADYITRH